MSPRTAGFTLIEMTIVLAIMAISATLVVPALVDLGRTPPHRTADVLLSLLDRSRRMAITSHVAVTVLIDPKSGAYRVDTIGLSDGGPVVSGTLELGTGEEFVSTLTRLHYVFQPSGAALADTVRVRGVDSALMVSVDPWTGVARAAVQ